MKRILIIGASGFIGKNLCQYLIHFDYEVFGFDITYPQNPVCGVNYLIGDFFDDSILEKMIAEKDYIIHAVSSINPGNSNEKYMQGYEKDFLQAVKLCRMIMGKNIRLVFLSSGGTVYGNHAAQPLNESVMPCPINHYGNIKLCIENMLRTFNYQMNTNAIIARISNPYGPGQDFHKGVGFVDAVLKKAIKKEPIEVWGDGENIRDYIYIDDVCQMLKVLLEYKGEFDTFNISSGVGVSQNKIIQITEQMGLNPQVIYKEGRSVDVRKIVLDNKRIKNLYNRKLKDLKEGMKIYYNYLIRQC